MNINNNLGGVLIVSGTTIGAGMLALPITSAHLGFSNSTILLFVMWLLMSYTALITLEINLHFKESLSVAEIANRVLGKSAWVITSIAIALLFYSLLAAYISGSTSIIKQNLNADIPQHLISVMFTIFFGGLIYLSTKAVDYGNRIFFGIKVVIFCVMIAFFIPHINLQNFANEGSNAFDKSLLFIAIPIFFTSFGFHGSIPAIVRYLGKEPQKLVKVFLVGSIIPLAIYTIWQGITLGVLPNSGSHSFEHVASLENDVGDFVTDLTAITSTNSIFYISSSFAWLAIVTSFLGVALGLFDFVMEFCKYSHNSSVDKFKGVLWTFIAPLIISMTYQSIFVKALAFAAISLSILAVIMPCLIAYKLRLSNKHKSIYYAPGGDTGLIIGFLFGIIVIFLELSNLFF